MGEAWLDSSVRSGPVPDFPAGLDGFLARPGPSSSETADGSTAYGPLVSHALFEVVARGNRPRPSTRHCIGGTVAVSPDIRVPAFVEALFEKGVRRCEAIADAAFAEAPDPQAVAGSLFGPAAEAVGARWIADEADFLQVTVALARMQRLFARMAVERPPTAPSDPGRRLLLAPAPGEQHCFGLSIVEDAFLRAGWTVDRCGHDDGERTLRMAGARDYSLIGLTIGSKHLLPELGAFVGRLRAASRNGSAVLMAGGGVAIRQPQSMLDLGFDAVAADVSSGLRLAQSLVAQVPVGARPSAFAH